MAATIQSTVKAIGDLRIKPFPERVLKMRIISFGSVVVGQSLEAKETPIVYCNEFPSDTTNKWYDYWEQNRKPIGQFLECLVGLGLVTEEEMEEHLAGLESHKRRQNVSEMKRQLTEMAKNEFFCDFLKRTHGKVPEMLTGDEEAEREMAKAVMQIKECLND